MNNVHVEHNDLQTTHCCAHRLRYGGDSSSRPSNCRCSSSSFCKCGKKQPCKEKKAKVTVKGEPHPKGPSSVNVTSTQKLLEHLSTFQRTGLSQNNFGSMPREMLNRIKSIFQSKDQWAVLRTAPVMQTLNLSIRQETERQGEAIQVVTPRFGHRAAPCTSA